MGGSISKKKDSQEISGAFRCRPHADGADSTCAKAARAASRVGRGQPDAAAERLQRIPDARLPVDQGSVGVEGQYRKVAEAHGGSRRVVVAEKSAENLDRARRGQHQGRARTADADYRCDAKHKKSCIYTSNLVV